MYEEYLKYVKDYLTVHTGNAIIRESHAEQGAKIFYEYGIKTGMDLSFTETFVYSCK